VAAGRFQSRNGSSEAFACRTVGSVELIVLPVRVLKRFVLPALFRVSFSRIPGTQYHESSHMVYRDSDADWRRLPKWKTIWRCLKLNQASTTSKKNNKDFRE
jgi:hypothetical protein